MGKIDLQEVNQLRNVVNSNMRFIVQEYKGKSRSLNSRLNSVINSYAEYSDVTSKAREIVRILNEIDSGTSKIDTKYTKLVEGLKNVASAVKEEERASSSVITSSKQKMSTSNISAREIGSRSSSISELKFTQKSQLGEENIVEAGEIGMLIGKKIEPTSIEIVSQVEKQGLLSATVLNEMLSAEAPQDIVDEEVEVKETWFDKLKDFVTDIADNVMDVLKGIALVGSVFLNPTSSQYVQFIAAITAFLNKKGNGQGVNPVRDANDLSYLEGGILYENIDGRIYKNGELVAEEDYKYIPHEVGGLRENDGKGTFTKAYVENGTVYERIGDQIYKNGVLIPEENYKFIPKEIGGLRETIGKGSYVIASQTYIEGDNIYQRIGGIVYKNGKEVTIEDYKYIPEEIGGIRDNVGNGSFAQGYKEGEHTYIKIGGIIYKNGKEVKEEDYKYIPAEVGGLRESIGQGSYITSGLVEIIGKIGEDNILVTNDNEVNKTNIGTMSMKGINFLTALEGYKATPYRGQDAYNETIGYGHVIREGETFTYITEEEAKKLLLKDLEDGGYVEAVIKLEQSLGIVFSQCEFDALVSFSYNLGKNKLGSDDCKELRELLKDGNYTDQNLIDIISQFHHYREKKGGPLLDSRGLYNRRIDEAELFLYGDYNRRTDREIEDNYTFSGTQSNQDKPDISNEQESQKTTIPKEAWKPVIPGITNKVGERSPEVYNDVIDQFNVTTHSRYEAGKYTYCNIFAWDVMSAMGVELPQRVDSQTNEPRNFPDVKGTTELNANGMAKWLENYGAKYGWVEVTAKQAQEAANRGEPTVTAWNNPGGIGHFQVVRPTKGSDTYNYSTGVYVAQAGGTNFDYKPASSVYGQGAAMDKIKYYTHK